MTTIVYEELEDFFEQMKLMNKDKPVYMTVVRSRKESVLSGAVRVAFKDDTGCFHSYDHTEDIKEIGLLNANIFDMLPSETDRKNARADYLATIEGFDKALKGEYEKMKQVLTAEFGVTKIYPAHVG